MRNIFFLIMLIITLSGCANLLGQNGEEKKVETTNSTPKEDMIEEKKSEAKQKVNSTKATYIGLMDPHTIEVLIDNKPIAIQINEEQMKLLEQLKTNKQIYIEYFYNEETSQNILEKVEVD